MNRREYTVGDCFYQIRNGANIKQGDAAGGYPITRIETTANDTFNRDRMGYAGITDLSKYEGYVLEDGDLLMSHINSVQYLGRTVLYRKQGNETIIHGMNLLSLKANREIILPEFARYSFRSDPFKKQLSKITKKSVNQASFTVADLKKIPLAVPTLNKQRGIVQTLDKCLLVEAKRQQQLSALDDLIKARFVEMFGDTAESVSAGMIMSEMRNGVSPSTSGKCPEKVLTLSAITQGRFDPSMWKDGLFDNPPPAEKRIHATDFYMCRGNGNKSLVGAGVYSKEDREDLIFPDTVIAARVDITKVCLPYLLIAWMQPSVRDQIEAGARTTNGTYKINQQTISKINVPLPPLDAQKQFSAFVAQIDKSKSAIQKSLDETQLLFDSLMQKYFG